MYVYSGSAKCQDLCENGISYFWAKCLEVAGDQYLRSEQQRIGHYPCNVQSTIHPTQIAITSKHWIGCILIHQYPV